MFRIQCILQLDVSWYNVAYTSCVLVYKETKQTNQKQQRLTHDVFEEMPKYARRET